MTAEMHSQNCKVFELAKEGGRRGEGGAQGFSHINIAVPHTHAHTAHHTHTHMHSTIHTFEFTITSENVKH